MPHYFISGVRDTASIRNMTCLQIMEEQGTEQVVIALVPYSPRHPQGWELAQKDAKLIVEALNNHHD